MGLSVLPEGDRGEGNDLLQELYSNAKTSSSQVLETIGATGDELLMVRLLSLNDDIQSALAVYDDIKAGRPRVRQHPQPQQGGASEDSDDSDEDEDEDGEDDTPEAAAAAAVQQGRQLGSNQSFDLLDMGDSPPSKQQSGAASRDFLSDFDALDVVGDSGDVN